MTGRSEWTLDNFDTWLARWRVSEKPDDDLQIIVADWIIGRSVDPFQGAEPDSDLPDLWHARIPHSGDGCGNVVCCSYWIDRTSRTVTCDILNSLAYP